MTSATFSSTATVHTVREELVETNVDGDIVVLHTGKSLIYGLNTVGSRVWQLLEEAPLSVSDICAALCQEFEVDPTECDRQVRKLLEDLLTEGLLAVTDAAQAPVVAASRGLFPDREPTS